MSNEYKDYRVDRYNELIDIINGLEDALMFELSIIKAQVETGVCDFITEKAIAQGKLTIINKVLRSFNPESADEITATIENEIMKITI